MNTKDILGKILAISISDRKGIKKNNVSSAKLIEDYGIEGDAHAGKWHRQVSFLSIDSIDKMRNAGLHNLKPGDFAENITTEFINIPELTVGTKLKLGNKAILEITQIGKECHSRCEIFEAIGDCIMPKEGIFAKVLESGEIFINDNVEII